MNDASNSNWQPDPQLLAAYFDGELEGRDDLADLRARLESWMDRHPEAAGDRASHQQLQKLWLATTPAEPTAAAWRQSLDRLAGQRQQPPTRRRPWVAVGVLAASVAILVGLLFGAARLLLPNANRGDGLAIVPKTPSKTNPEQVEVFAVASADEVTILHIEGADTSSVVIGRMPVQGPLELAAPGEVRVTHVRPDARDQMMPTVRRQGSPMIWAKLETE